MSVIITRWRNLISQLAGQEVWKSADEEVPPHFFHYFRPTGKGLDEVFQGVAYGDEILARLKEVYRVAGDGNHGDSHDMYFIVRKPNTVPGKHLLLLAEQHFSRLAEMLVAIGGSWDAWKDELRPLREGRLSIEVVEGSPPDRPANDIHPIESALYELSGAFMERLKAEKSDASLLKDALYHLACSYELVNHLLWPIYRSATRLHEPFRPNFQLWTLGVKLRYEAVDHCRVYVPRIIPDANG